MGDSLCLQRWINVAGNNNLVVQNESDWLCVDGFKDVSVYAEVAFVTDQASVTTLQVQTAPSRDDLFFSANFYHATDVPYIAQYTFSSTPTLGMQTLQVIRFADVGTTIGPLSRIVRWSVQFPPAETNISFRLWLNLNRGGR